MKKLSEIVSMRFDAADKKELEQAAEKQGLKFIQLVRVIIKEWLRKYRKRVK
jgi:hypothetical protein